jgi:hypothetical protein
VATAETKIPRFCPSDWVPFVAVAEYLAQVHGGVRVLAQVDIHDALKGGCRSLLQSVKDGRKIHTYPPPEFWHPPNRLDWVNALNLSQRLADFLDRPWPWELRVALTLSEHESLGASVDVFLHRADAVRWGLWQAKPEPTEIAEAKPEPPQADPAPAPPTEPLQVDPAPSEAEPAPPPPIESPPEEAEQQRPPLLLPDEPQFEEPRKWRPEEVQTWFKNIRKTHRKKPEETKSAYARRLYEHMKNDFEEDIPWTEWTTLLRRLNDPSTKDD